ncbi:hypothetical protein BGX31_011119 [Mortierella sp. GBA43]|nr:hypothetical protein BGX31_011119 [Mortierella sp. GBA43]
MTVGTLKKSIKLEKTPEFDDIAADRLVLWRVSTPSEAVRNITLSSLEDDDKARMSISDKELNSVDDLKEADQLILWKVEVLAAPINERKLIVLREIEGGTELDSLDGLSTVFESQPSKKTVSIIAERPPSAVSSSLTPTAKTVPYSCIGQEIVMISEEEGRYYIKHSMDRTLMGKEATSHNGEPPRTIVEGDINKTSGQRVVTLIGPSDSGKTATVIDLAKTHSVIYCVCYDPKSVLPPDFKDPNFVTLARDFETMANKLPKPETLDDLKKNNNTLKNLAQDHHFNEQTDGEINGGIKIVAKLVVRLREYEMATARNILTHVQDKLATYLKHRRLGPVIALDEAHIAGHFILADALIAPSALLTITTDIVDAKNQVLKEYRRGFLTPLCVELSRFPAALVILGTSLSLQDEGRTYSGLGKRSNFTKITKFPTFNEEEAETMLSELIDISDCTIQHSKRRKLSDRGRFSVNVVRKLFDHNDGSWSSKQPRLEDAVSATISGFTAPLEGRARSIVRGDLTNEAK